MTTGADFWQSPAIVPSGEGVLKLRRKLGGEPEDIDSIEAITNSTSGPRDIETAPGGLEIHLMGSAGSIEHQLVLRT